MPAVVSAGLPWGPAWYPHPRPVIRAASGGRAVCGCLSWWHGDWPARAAELSRCGRMQRKPLQTDLQSARDPGSLHREAAHQATQEAAGPPRWAGSAGSSGVHVPEPVQDMNPAGQDGPLAEQREGGEGVRATQNRRDGRQPALC